MNFLEKSLFESSIFLDEKEVFFFEFVSLFRFEVELSFVVSGLLNKKNFVLVEVDTSLLFHDFQINIFVGLFCQHEIVPHLFDDFAKGYKKVVFDFLYVLICKFAVVFQPLLNSSIHFLEVAQHLLAGVLLRRRGNIVFFNKIFIVLLDGLL